MRSPWRWLAVGSFACVAAAAEPPLELSVTDSVLMALERNRELAVERARPAVARTVALEEAGVFDPLLTVEELGWEGVEGRKLRGEDIIQRYDTESVVGEVGIETLLPTGTHVDLRASTEVIDETTRLQMVQSRVGITLTQSLLQGFGTAPHLARIRQAQADVAISEHELAGYSATLVSTIEQAHWDYVLHQRRVAILEEALAAAEAQGRETGERIRAGVLPDVEIVASESEVALRQEDLVDARADREKARLLLVQLLNPPGDTPWHREIRTREVLEPSTLPVAPVEEHVATALRLRPELGQARVALQRGQLEIVRTRNGMLPRMDLFVRVGHSGYADSFTTSWDAFDRDHPDLRAGLNVELPLRRSAARGVYERALLESTQSRDALANLEQLVEAEVRIAHVEVLRAQERARAAARTRALDERKMQIEIEKHRIDRASAFQVARAQRDLTRSRLDEAEALADERKALVELHRLDGSLLERRGVEVLGR